jgi:probable metal-binding protein
MPEPIHGHDLLSLLERRGGALPLEELRAAAATEFGAAAIYGNCKGMTFQLDELLRFFASRGKLAVVDGVARLGPAPACEGSDHGHDHAHDASHAHVA